MDWVSRWFDAYRHCCGTFVRFGMGVAASRLRRAVCRIAGDDARFTTLTSLARFPARRTGTGRHDRKEACHTRQPDPQRLMHPPIDA